MELREPQMKIGSLLVRRGQIKQDTLEFALNLQRSYSLVGRDLRLGELLVSHRAITEQILQETLNRRDHIGAESITKIIEAIQDFPSQITHLKPE